MDALVRCLMPPVLPGTLFADILTDRLGAELGAPVLAKPRRWWDMIAEIREGTDENPSSARTRTRLQRARRIALMAHKPINQCRRGHELNAANVYIGRNGSQCRSCRNANQRARRNAA